MFGKDQYTQAATVVMADRMMDDLKKTGYCASFIFLQQPSNDRKDYNHRQTENKCRYNDVNDVELAYLGPAMPRIQIQAMSMGM